MSSPRTQGEAFAGRKGEPEDTGMRRAPAAPIAVEVELTDKSARRLDEILRAWRRSLSAGQFGRVRYLCSALPLAYALAPLSCSHAEWAIDFEPLEGSGGPMGLAVPITR